METRLFIQGVNLKEDQAWKESDNYFYAPLCCYSARLIGDEDAAEDIVQDVYYGYGAHRSVFKISKSLLLIFIVLFIMLL